MKRRAYVEVPPAPYRIPRKRRRISNHEGNSPNLNLSPSHQNPVPHPIKKSSPTSPSAKQNLSSLFTLVSPINGDVRDKQLPVVEKSPTISPLKFSEDRAAKKAVLSKLRFKKISSSGEDVSTSPANTTSHEQYLEGAQYIPPSDEASTFGDIMHLLTQYAVQSNAFSVRIPFLLLCYTF